MTTARLGRRSTALVTEKTMKVLDARNPHTQPFEIENGLGAMLISRGYLVQYKPTPVTAAVSIGLGSFMDGRPFITGSCSSCKAKLHFYGTPEKADVFLHCRRDDIPTAVLAEYTEAYKLFFKQPAQVAKAFAAEVVSSM
jgi:hypothetical protein